MSRLKVIRPPCQLSGPNFSQLRASHTYILPPNFRSHSLANMTFPSLDLLPAAAHVPNPFHSDASYTFLAVTSCVTHASPSPATLAFFSQAMPHLSSLPPYVLQLLSRHQLCYTRLSSPSVPSICNSLRRMHITVSPFNYLYYLHCFFSKSDSNHTLIYPTRQLPDAIIFRLQNTVNINKVL